MEKYINRFEIEELNSYLKRASESISFLIENAQDYRRSGFDENSKDALCKKINVADLEIRIEHLNTVCKQIKKLKTINENDRNMFLVRDDGAD